MGWCSGAGGTREQPGSQCQSSMQQAAGNISGGRCAGLGGTVKGKGTGGGAGRDAFSRQQADARARASAQRDCRKDGPICTTLPRLVPSSFAVGAAAALVGGEEGEAGREEGEVDVGGVHVPAQLRGHADVSYVLNQQPGKLRTKDVKVRDEWQEASREGVEKVARRPGGDLGVWEPVKGDRNSSGKIDYACKKPLVQLHGVYRCQAHAGHNAPQPAMA